MPSRLSWIAAPMPPKPAPTMIASYSGVTADLPFEIPLVFEYDRYVKR